MIIIMKILLAFILLSFQAEASDRSSKVGIDSQGDCFEWGVEYHGGGLDNPLVTGVNSPDRCQYLCQQRQGCQYFAWVNSQHDVLDYRNTCWLKETSGTHQPCATCVSGNLKQLRVTNDHFIKVQEYVKMNQRPQQVAQRPVVVAQ